MPLIYAGIDEAGYGPMLGPLAVAAAVFEIRDWTDPAPPPDLWHTLRRIVGRVPADAPRLIPIADSKKLKLANTNVRKHPLTHLEAAVLAMLAVAGTTVNTDAELVSALGATWENHPWYAGTAQPLPLCSDAESATLRANALRAACDRAGVAPLALKCRLIGETAFNEALTRRGTKAAVTGDAVAALIRGILTKWGSSHTIRISVDRQSGRSDYRALLARAVPDGTVIETHREPGISRYTLHDPAFTTLDAAVRFETKAEDRHLPVALASMTAKFARELSMLRFNRYWCARIPEIKPTAGYVTDARRWLADAERALTADERQSMVRMA